MDDSVFKKGGKVAEKLIELSQDDFILGQPLRWSIYDRKGIFLIKKGYLVETEHQIDRMLLHGAFALHEDMTAGKTNKLEKVKEPEQLSPFELIEKATAKLYIRLLVTKNYEDDFTGQIMSVVDDIQLASKLDSHAALASLFLVKYDHYPIKHSVDVAVLCESLGKSMGLSLEQRRSIVAAALTMNIAMLELQEILYHQESPLTEQQKKAIFNHPKEGEEMLREAKIDDGLWLNCVLAHHEKVNGHGYPNQLNGSEYPQVTQIIVLADQYCARLSPRSYRQPLLHKGILRDILLDKGETVNEDTAALFIKELGFFPPGLIVKLNNGEIGIIRERGKRANTPVVQVCIRPRSGKLMIPIRQDTSTDTFKVKQILLPDDPEVIFDARTIWGG